MTLRAPTVALRGVQVWKGWFDRAGQAALLEEARAVARAAPPVSPETRFGKMSVKMTSAGRVGWIADRRGYRYAAHPPGGTGWPPIPPLALEVWRAVTGTGRDPDCCLLNHYGEGARMGLHQDRDEGDFDWPVLSISLGDSGLFRVGGTTRGGTTESLWLDSGDVALMGGAARMAYHGIDRIRFGSSDLLPKGGRLNLTLRVVDLPG